MLGDGGPIARPGATAAPSLDERRARAFIDGMHATDPDPQGGQPAQGPNASAKKPLSPAAERALAEAAARRAERDRAEAERPKELHGRGGRDPTRYGDWEVNGSASDF
jgi:hypothetical protein